jgi:biopolymer transport protein ExbD
MKVKMPSREDASVDMAPMIDLVFLLLIFFMVASVVTTKKIDVAIPESRHAKVPKDIKDRMMVSIDALGNYYAYTDPTPLKIEEMKDLIEQELDINPNLRILIRADERVEYEVCKKFMIACGDVGATDLIYAAFEAGQ